MTLTQQLEQLWILVPVAILLVAGFAITLRSGDVHLGSGHGVRQVVGNFTSTVALVGLCLVFLMVIQSVVGFNLKASW